MTPKTEDRNKPFDQDAGCYPPLEADSSSCSSDCSARANVTFDDWWHTDGIKIDAMGRESIYDFAYRIGKLAYGAGICEGMTRHNLRQNAESSHARDER